MGIQWKRVNWVLDADIRGFFDNMSHEWAMKFIEHRVADRSDTSPDPKMAEGGSIGRWPVVGNEVGYAARSSGLTAARQRVPALRIRPVG